MKINRKLQIYSEKVAFRKLFKTICHFFRHKLLLFKKICGKINFARLIIIYILTIITLLHKKSERQKTTCQKETKDSAC
jgi:hypothetical protein